MNFLDKLNTLAAKAYQIHCDIINKNLTCTKVQPFSYVFDPETGDPIPLKTIQDCLKYLPEKDIYFSIGNLFITVSEEAKNSDFDDDIDELIEEAYGIIYNINPEDIPLDVPQFIPQFEKNKDDSVLGGLLVQAALKKI